MENSKPNKALRFIFIAVLPLIIVFTALNGGGSSPGTKELLSILLWGLGIVVIRECKRFPRLPVIPAVLWLVFWLVGTATIITAWSPDGVVRFTIQIGALLVFAYVTYMLAEKPFFNFFRVFYLGVAVIVLIGYYFLVAARIGFYVGRHDMMLHFISTFFWKNPAGGYLVLVLPLAVMLSVTESQKSWRIFYIVLSSLSIGALLLTRSRGAWLAIFIAAIIAVIIGWRIAGKYFKRALLLICIGIIISFIVMPPGWVLGRFIQVSEVAKKDAEEPIEERRMMISMGLRMLEDNPFLGIGMGSFKVAYPSYLASSHYLSSHLHNQYLQYAAEGGIMGFLIFAAAIAVSVLYILFTARKKKDPILWGIAFGTLAYAIHMGLDFDWEFWGTSLPFFALMSIGLRSSYDKHEPVKPEKIQKVLVGIVLLLGFLVSLSVGIAWTLHGNYEAAISGTKQLRILNKCTILNPFSALFQHEKSMVLKSMNEIDESKAAIERAYSLEPKNIMLSYQKGFMLWDTDRAEAIELLINTVRDAPYVLPQKQLDFATDLLEINKDALAEFVLNSMMASFSTGANVRYSERTVGFRYIISRAVETLGNIMLEKKEFDRADSLYRLAQVLGCPRYRDRLAAMWDIDSPAPEWIIYEMIEAVNVGDSMRVKELITGSSGVRLTPGNKLYLLRIMDVKIDMLSEKASVDVLMARTEGKHIFRELGFFKLILTEEGWKIEL